MPKAPGSELRIAELARMAGIGVETVRYYERRGLVRPSRRTAGGYRRYDLEAVRRVRFIKRAQRFGFSLDVIAELMQLPCADVRARAERQVNEIEAKRRELDLVHATLRGLVATCGRDPDRPRCPIVDALLADTDPFPERG